MELTKYILKEIDKQVQLKHKEEPKRKHLGASLIGQPCARQIWYGFRWAAEERHSGRLLRLFNRGHLEEARFIEFLRSVGIFVSDVDKNGKQFRIEGVNGHLGGSCDGVCFIPANFPGLPPNWDYNTPVLNEFKTHGDKSFKELEKKGMAEAKPQHKAQIDTYGFKMGIHYYLYMAVNKNTDDLYLEFGSVDMANGEAMCNLAEHIINSPSPPNRQFAKGHIQCKWCSYNKICHYDQSMELNCRSCANAQPIENKQWYCHYNRLTIPEEVIPNGCSVWTPADV